MKTPLIAMVGVAAYLACTPAAHAQATRTWVSGVGDDANPCSRTAPCKTFAGAISKTAAGGEIDALDPAGYGAVTITKSITIDGGAGLASVLVAGTKGIVVNAAATDVVTIRRVSINGSGTGTTGVEVTRAKHVNIEDAVIFGFGGGHGVVIGATSDATVQIANSRIENNGVDASGTSPMVLVSNSNLSMNGRGIHTGGGAVVRMTHLDIFFNTTYAWEIGGGQIETHVDNRVLGATSGTLTKVSY